MTSPKVNRQGFEASDRSSFLFERFDYLAIVAIAMTARLAFGFLKLNDAPADPDHYLALANSLIDGQGLSYQGRPTAYRPPLYPVLLAPLAGFLGHGKSFHAALIIFQAVIGGATAYLTMRAAMMLEKAGNGQDIRPANMAKSKNRARLTCALAGMWTALDPLLVSQAPLIMTETLAAFLITAAVHALVRDRPNAAGFWFGLAGLCRPSLLACFGLTVAARFATPSGLITKRCAGEAFRITICCALTMTPWAVRNWLQFGEPVLTTTHGGYTMALANNATYYEEVVFGPPNAIWTGPRQQAWMDSIGTDTIGLTEPQADRKIRAKAAAFIREHPRDFLISSIHRQLRFWAIAPAAEVYGPKIRSICAIWTFPVWFLALVALYTRSTWTWPTIATVAVAAGLAAVHLVYWTDIRMRAPIVPTLAILAARGASASLQFRER